MNLAMHALIQTNRVWFDKRLFIKSETQTAIPSVFKIYCFLRDIRRQTTFTILTTRFERKLQTRPFDLTRRAINHYPRIPLVIRF